MQSNIESLVTSTIANLKQVVDVNNVVGQPTIFGTVTVIPIAKVTCGFISGGGEYGDASAKSQSNHAGGSGGGINVNPIGFLVVEHGKVSMIRIDKEVSESKWSDLIETAKNLIKK